jgi:hypothetical protein
MQVFMAQSRGAPIKAYINVGGGAVSVGRATGKKRYRPGLNLQPPPSALEIDSVMTRFMKRKTPIIHLVDVGRLAAMYGLPEAPTTMPAVGAGAVLVRREYNRWLAGGALATIAVVLRAFVLRDWGYRLRDFLRGRNPGLRPLAPFDAGPTLMV